jgi:hypothetical protein
MPPLALARRSSGLSAGHVALIKMLAQIAAEQFLAESEPNNTTEAAPADERQAVAP